MTHTDFNQFYDERVADINKLKDQVNTLIDQVNEMIINLNTNLEDLQTRLDFLIEYNETNVFEMDESEGEL